MHFLRHLMLLSLFAAPCLAVNDNGKDQFDAWRPITQGEAQLKDVPGNSGAAAIQLYYGETRDDTAQFEFIYRRVKILNERGMKYADVEIDLGPNQRLVDLKARTIHPDGKIIDFSDRVFDKTILKGRGIKISAKVFTLPEVTVGSIVECKYKITWQGNIIFDSYWLLQYDLFTVKEEFRFKPFSGPILTKDGLSSRLSYAYLNMVSQVSPEKKGDFWRLDVENMPAMAEEEYAPPDGAYRPMVYFYYGGKEVASPDLFWQDMSKIWNERSERFIGNSKEIKETAGQATSGETDPEKKLRKLYARAQQLRNLSYERERTQEEEKKEGLKLGESAAEVLKRQYGTREEINGLFVALARSAGFTAYVLRVPNREATAFNKSILFAQQMGSEIVSVELNGKSIFLDPGTKYCPYGLVRWTRTAVPALKLDKNGGAFVDVPAPLPEDSVIARTTDGTLDATGLLQGTLTVEYRGQAALEHRLEAFATDDAGRKKNLEEEISSLLPSGALIELKDAQGWNESEQPLVVHFSLRIPSFAAAAGKRLVAPAFLFQSKPRKIFVSSLRRAPIVFPSSFTELDTVKITLPKGYALEHPPHERKTRLYDASYEILNSFAEDQLTVKRALSLKGVRFGLERYTDLKDFFGVVQAGDEGQAILQLQTGTAAQ